jgi:hypothetical protein
MDLDDSNGIKLIDINKLLSLHKLPNWEKINKLTINDIL